MIVTDVCGLRRAGKPAVTIVAPDPPVRNTEHSPPESSGATSGLKARMDASSVRGTKLSLPLTRRIIIALPVGDPDAGAPGAGAAGAGDWFAAAVQPVSSTHSTEYTRCALMACAASVPGGSGLDMLHRAARLSP